MSTITTAEALRSNRHEMNHFRRLLRNTYGKSCYRITSGDEVHAYGTMPNTNQDGWYFVGWLLEVYREYCWGERKDA